MRYEIYDIYSINKMYVIAGEAVADLEPFDEKAPRIIFQEKLDSINLFVPTSPEEKLLIGKAQAISCQSTREMAGIYTLHRPRQMRRGKVGLAGSILICSLDRDALNSWIREMRGIYDPEPFPMDPDKVVLEPFYADQVPPLDITVLTESGKEVLIDGLELFNEGWGVSIGDPMENEQYTYLCRNVRVRIPIETDNPFDLLRKLA